MKERLIEWTRNEKNELKIVIGLLAIGVIEFFNFGVETNWGKRELSVGGSILLVFIFLSIWGVYIITNNLFKVKEDTLRKNKISLIIFANEQLWMMILTVITVPTIYSEVIKETTIILEIVVTIFTMIVLVKTSILISSCFKKKLK